MSDLPLTGYDNHDAVSGVADEEVFLYDAQANKLVCASCNPSGARPRGMFDKGNGKEGTAHEARTHVDPQGAWEGRWVAGSMPGWRPFARTIRYMIRVSCWIRVACSFRARTRSCHRTPTAGRTCMSTSRWISGPVTKEFDVQPLVRGLRQPDLQWHFSAGIGFL